ncbi:hypothetical protein ACFODZ_00340 [Marinicella sediminis]|uniref:Uncharacterized protein n=1 Tax=Marinicella sediminis TaxID=1792834 RepID=A0ABV7J6Z9_9GAMM|nr:hypothetical protein [Marinicella sediminis]
MRTLIILVCLLSGSLSQAQETNDTGLFATGQPLPAFQSTKDLTDYLKNEMPGTFRYYERLDTTSRKKVLEQLLADADSDLTEIVIQVYRQRPR